MTTTGPRYLIVDANVLIALCSKERDKCAVAEGEWRRYAMEGYRFYAPGVIVSEALFVLCRKLKDKILSAEDHAAAVEDLCLYLQAVLPPPQGDGVLAKRAEELRRDYGCSRSADGLYLALTEYLSEQGPTEIVTFDQGIVNHAKSNAPSVKVNLLWGVQGA